MPEKRTKYDREFREGAVRIVKETNKPIAQIHWNLADGWIDAIPDRVSEAEVTIWEPNETARFLEHVAGDRLAALYELAAYCGLRRGELCGLRWSDIDEDGAGLSVRQTVVTLSSGQARPGDLVCPTCGREHIGRFFKGPKSKAGRRWLPLASPARQALASHRQRQADERSSFGPDYLDHDVVFCRGDGAPSGPARCPASWTLIRATAGYRRPACTTYGTARAH